MADHSGPGTQPVVETGIEGLDVILRGGLIQTRMYLVEGDPGCGKTTLGLQYLSAVRIPIVCGGFAQEGER